MIGSIFVENRRHKSAEIPFLDSITFLLCYFYFLYETLTFLNYSDVKFNLDLCRKNGFFSKYFYFLIIIYKLLTNSA